MNEIDTYKDLFTKELSSIPKYPNIYSGQGIVIVAGGWKYLTNAWVAVNILRRVGCTLPIEIFYLGKSEVVPEIMSPLKDLGVTFNCVDNLSGWQCKPYAIINSSFKDVLLMDADNVVTRDPSFLFKSAQYKSTGTIFWKDIDYCRKNSDIWEIIDVPYHKLRGIESGQVFIDKEKCWSLMHVVMHFNKHSKYYYKHTFGDKDTFNFASLALKQKITLVEYEPYILNGDSDIISQMHCDFDGRWLFQHRIAAKWKFDNNARSPLFVHEDMCIEYLEDLKSRT